MKCYRKSRKMYLKINVRLISLSFFGINLTKNNHIYANNKREKKTFAKHYK